MLKMGEEYFQNQGENNMKKKSRFKNWLINLLLLLLLLVGLGLTFNNQIKNFLIEKNGEKFAVSEVTAAEIEKNQQKPASFDFDAVVPSSSQAVFKAQFTNRDLPTIGGIAVPKVGINLPIFKGLANEALLWGAGTLEPNQKMGEGNYALASHRAYEPDLLFTPLERVKKGDVIYLTDLKNIYTYETKIIVRVQPTEVQYLDVIKGKKLVTLITCGEIEGITRTIVQGELKEVTPVNKATKDMRDAFLLKSKTY